MITHVIFRWQNKPKANTNTSRAGSMAVLQGEERCDCLNHEKKCL